MDFRARNLAPDWQEDMTGCHALRASAQRHLFKKANESSGAVGLLVVLALLALSPPATAHDIYGGLYSNYGTACCDDSDCRPAHYRATKAGVQMRIDQKWISVPPSAIQYKILPGDRGETAGGHWCGRLAHDVEVLNDPLGNGYFTFCAILPPNFAAADIKGSR